MPDKVEEILKTSKAIADTVEEVKSDVENFKTTQQEVMAKVQKQVDDLQEAQKELRRNTLPSDSPNLLDPSEIDTIANKGLFGGASPLDYEKMLSFSPNDSIVRGTRAAEQLERAHLYHDAFVLRHWHLRRKYDHSTAERMIWKHPDTQAYVRELQKMGYFKANEVINPDDASGYGNHLTYELLSAAMIDKIRLALVVAENVQQFTMTQARMKFPVKTGDTTGVRGGVDASQPPVKDHASDGAIKHIPAPVYFQKPTWSNVAFDAGHILGYIQWNDDMMEESILPWIPMMREEVARSVARAIDKAILDGDSGAASAHIDNDVQSGDNNQAVTAWDGLRKMTRGNSGTALASGAWISDTAITTTDVPAIMKKMGIYGLNPSDLVFAIPFSVYYNLLAQGEVMTLEKFGPQATIKTGVLGKIFGVDIIIPEFIRTDIDAQGVNHATPGNNTQTWAVMWNRNHFRLGRYNNLAVETTRNAPMLHTVIQADLRCDFKCTEVNLLTSGVFNASLASYPAVSVINLNN